MLAMSRNRFQYTIYRGLYRGYLQLPKHRKIQLPQGMAGYEGMPLLHKLHCSIVMWTMDKVRIYMYLAPAESV